MSNASIDIGFISKTPARELFLMEFSPTAPPLHAAPNKKARSDRKINSWLQYERLPRERQQL
ncbi:hypothetical protein EDS67_05800 [candidate division KSB1 bacterium]|nr:MAG: hypothetical protein EDS67_05800 [candidate division KSB1 bacterium]MBC6949489.1 hypothetical protein [candidate division KSB1 bacterium]MCE7940345.1 hypothetical protein [Chlorobi bacterium CHB1]